METNATEKSERYLAAEMLHSVAIHLLRRVRTQDESLGIGPTQLSALSVLVFGGPCSLKQLAAAEQVKPPTMSRVVAALERQKLAYRRPAADDARRIVLAPTSKGIALMHRGRDQRVRTLDALFAGISDAEVQVIEAAIGIVNRALRG